MSDSQLPIIDAIDMEILMHRDAHFGSNFETMLEYYEQQGVGVMPDFQLEEIKKLKNLEQQMHQNLSEVYLPEPAKKVVEESRKLYQSLRDNYSNDNASPISLIISDLILAEEEIPEKEIAAVVNQGKEIVPALIDLISSPSFYEPLYPGYGRAPIFAARCLAMIQDERSIKPLFEAIGHDNFFTDEEIIRALRTFGDIAKSFLAKVLKTTPFSKDNEHAAIALSAFPEDEEIAKCCLEVLQNEEVFKRPTLAHYLIFPCISLKELKDQQAFIALSKQKNLPKVLFDEMQHVIKSWKKTT